METETTTKQTTTFPDGHTEVTESTTKEGDANTDKQQKDLCEKNPGLTICQNSTIGGDCETTVCTGDAITCAIAQAARIANCKRRESDDAMKNSPEYALGNAALSGNDPAQNLPTRSNAQTIAVNNLDSSGWLGGGACFPDKSFEVQGHTIAIPFSSVCEYLVGLRYAMMVLAGLLAFRVLAGSVLKD